MQGVAGRGLHDLREQAVRIARKQPHMVGLFRLMASSFDAAIVSAGPDVAVTADVKTGACP